MYLQIPPLTSPPENPEPNETPHPEITPSEVPGRREAVEFPPKRGGFSLSAQMIK